MTCKVLELGERVGHLDRSFGVGKTLNYIGRSCFFLLLGLQRSAKPRVDEHRHTN